MIVALVTNLSLVLGLSILAVLAARFVKRPGVLHGIWLLLLLRLFVPPLLQVSCLPASWLEGSGQQLLFPRVEPTQAVVLGKVPDSRSPIEPAPIDGSWSFSWGQVLLGLWLLGSLVVLVVTLSRVHRFRRVLSLAVPADSRLQERTARLAQQLGLAWTPLVQLIPGRFPPLIWTSLRSQILVLPSLLVSRLSQAELDTLLVHELAHIRRRDHCGFEWWS